MVMPLAAGGAGLIGVAAGCIAGGLIAIGMVMMPCAACCRGCVGIRSIAGHTAHGTAAIG